jgi:hypothetical protein
VFAPNSLNDQQVLTMCLIAAFLLLAPLTIATAAVLGYLHNGKGTVGS